MWWAAAIQGGMALFGAIGQKGAADDARKLSDANVKASRAETKETLRRFDAQGKQQVGYTRAVAGASGFSVQEGTSQQSWINEMIAENRRQRDFISKSGERDVSIIKAGGERAQSLANAGALSSLGSAAGSFGDMWGSENAPWNS